MLHWFGWLGFAGAIVISLFVLPYALYAVLLMIAVVTSRWAHRHARMNNHDSVV